MSLTLQPVALTTCLVCCSEGAAVRGIPACSVLECWPEPAFISQEERLRDRKPRVTAASSPEFGSFRKWLCTPEPWEDRFLLPTNWVTSEK